MIFNKKNKDMKLVDKDVGFVEDAWEFIKHAVGDESHCFGSYVSTGDINYLYELEKARKLRTEVMDILSKEVVAQNWCFAPETKIVCDGNMKDIKDIKIGDNVLTHKNRFRKVLSVSKRKITDTICLLKTNYSNIEIKVTGGHLFYVANNLREPQKKSWKKNYKKPRFVWKKVEELNRNDFLYLPRYNIEKSIDELDIIYKNKKKYTNFSDSLNIKLTNNIMKLIGLYIAEGHHCEGENSKQSKYPGWKNQYVGFSFGKKERELAKFVIDVFKEEFDYITKPLYRESTIEFNIGKRVICKFFSQFSNNANSKKIPPWVINLPKEKLIHLVKGMIEGDGCLLKNRVTYSTVSKELAYQLRLILMKLGILSSIKNYGRCKSSYINGREIISRYDRYNLTISGDAGRELSKLIDLPYDCGKKTSGNFGYVGYDYFLIPIINIKKLDYKGEVYNLEVEEDNSYCTFQGVAHNCRIKHLAGKSMTAQELCTRYLSVGDEAMAKKLADYQKELYLSYLKILGFTEKNIKCPTLA